MRGVRRSDLRLGYLIHDVSRLRRLSFDRELAPLGITRSHWWVLAFIARNDGLPQTELANELEVGKVALGALVDRLESAGLVERRPEATDRRVKRVFLTDRACALLEEIQPISKAFNERLLDDLTIHDLEVTARTLNAMKQNMVAGTGWRKRRAIRSA